MIRNPIFLGKCQIDGNQSPPTSFPFQSIECFHVSPTSAGIEPRGSARLQRLLVITYAVPAVAMPVTQIEHMAGTMILWRWIFSIGTSNGRTRFFFFVFLDLFKL